MIDIAWLCVLAIRSVYWLVMQACHFLGYSTLWAQREIKKRDVSQLHGFDSYLRFHVLRTSEHRCGIIYSNIICQDFVLMLKLRDIFKHALSSTNTWERSSFDTLLVANVLFFAALREDDLDGTLSMSATRVVKIPAHVAIVISRHRLDKITLMSLLNVCLGANIQRLTIYDARNDYSELVHALRAFCAKKRIKLIVGCTELPTDYPSYHLFVQLLNANCGRSILVETCRELSSSVTPISVAGVTSHLASRYALCEPELLIQVGSTPTLYGYPPWCLHVTEIIHVQALPCTRSAFDECLEAFSRREIRLGK